jgi:hypothetical protein
VRAARNALEPRSEGDVVVHDPRDGIEAIGRPRLRDWLNDVKSERLVGLRVMVLDQVTRTGTAVTPGGMSSSVGAFGGLMKSVPAVAVRPRRT